MRKMSEIMNENNVEPTAVETEIDTVAPVAEAETTSVNDAETSPAVLQPKEMQTEDDKKQHKKDKFDVTTDIKFRGPLSYRHLKLLGWLCIVLTQIGVVENLKHDLGASTHKFFLGTEIMDFISTSALPLLLLSVFAFLIKKRDNYMKTLITYAGLSLVMVGVFVIIYERYILGIAGSLLPLDRSALREILDQFLYDMDGYKGFLPFNIFVDLFLCTLVMFFLDYQPQKYFAGKKIYLFRGMVAIPLAYEVVCLVLKILATDQIISLPLWVSPFLTTKPPVSILMFLSIVRYIRLREKQFFKNGRTMEEYNAFLETNTNSMQFSKHLMLIILVYTVLDLIIMFLVALIYATVVIGSTEGTSVALQAAISKAQSWGFGGTARMINLLPIVLLFSYTRSHKNQLIDTAIPAVSAGIIFLAYFDGIFQIVRSTLASGAAA